MLGTFFCSCCRKVALLVSCAVFFGSKAFLAEEGADEGTEAG